MNTVLLLQTVQSFMMEKRDEHRKAIRKAPIDKRAKEELSNLLDACLSTPKISVSRALTEHELALLVQKIDEDLVAFIEYNTAFISHCISQCQLINAETEQVSNQFNKQPLYLKPLYCFSAAYKIIFNVLRYKKIYGIVESLEAIDAETGTIYAELQLYLPVKKDYYKLSRMMNQGLLYIRKEVFHTLNLNRLPKYLSANLSDVEPYYLKESDSHDVEAIAEMFRFFTDRVVEEVSRNKEIIRAINQEIDTLTKYIDTTFRIYQSRPLLMRVFYIFTYLESKRSLTHCIYQYKDACRSVSLSVDRLDCIAVILKKEIGELKTQDKEGSA